MLEIDQYRRLSGNDIGVIVFKEFGTVVVKDLECGAMPQVFAAVQPCGTKYQMAFFSKKDIPVHPPVLPENHLFNPEEMRDFLYCKMTNGILMSQLSPPLDRILFVPRSEYLETFKIYSTKKGDTIKRKEKEKTTNITPRKRSINISISNDT